MSEPDHARPDVVEVHLGVDGFIRLVAGDDDLGPVYDAHRRDLLAFAAYRGAHDPDDVVQEAWRRALPHLVEVADGQRLAYLKRAVASIIVERARTRRRERERLGERVDADAAWAVASGEPLTEERVILAELVDRAWAAAEAAPPRVQVAMVLQEMGYSIGEIADIQGATPGAVRTALYRGRKASKRRFLERRRAEGGCDA